MFRAFAAGITAAATAPRLLLVVWLTLLLAAAPFGLLLQQEIERDVGASRVHVELRQRMDLLWLDEFHHRSTGLGAELTPDTVSRVDFLRNVDLLLSGELFARHRGLVAAGVGYALVWLLLLGGAIDRFARGRGRLVLSQFLAASGRYFPRLLRLGAVSGLLYWLLYRLARWAWDVLDPRLLDVTSESSIFGYYLGLAIPMLLVACVVKTILDYARVASVLEEEPNTLRALRSGLRFFGRNAAACLGLVLLVALAVAALVAARTAWSPEVTESTTWGILGVFALGQAFILLRLALRLAFVAAELHLYRARRR
jgi:hypothetical protein